MEDSQPWASPTPPSEVSRPDHPVDAVEDAVQAVPPEPKNPEQAAPEEPGPEIKEHKSTPERHLPPSPPVKISELRKAVHDVVPLLADQDPGGRKVSLCRMSCGANAERAAEP